MKRYLTSYLLIALCTLYIPQSNAQNCTDIGTNAGQLPTVLVDVFKSSRGFWETDLVNWTWDTGTPLPLDANGYPTSLNAGFAARTLLMEALDGNYPTGTYTLLYDGEGSIILGMNAENAVFTDNGGVDNQIIFEVNTPTLDGIMVDITETTVGNHIHNIRIIRPDEAGTNFLNTYQTTPFIPAFYNQLSNYKILRFMDWQATNWSAQEFWANRPQLETHSWAFGEGYGGVPVEIMVSVANDLNINPWFCMPHRATDNYITQFASYVAANLNPELKAYIEYSNEVWNPLFSDNSWEEMDGQHSHANDMAAANGITGFSESIGYWVGRRSAEMFDLWSAAFGGDDSRLVKVIPIQTGTGLATPYTLDYDHNGTPLYQIGDIVSGAGYFDGNYLSYDLANMTVDELLDEIEAHMYDFDSGPYWVRQTVLMLSEAPYAEYQLPFVCYEGGQHLANWFGTPTDPVTALLIDANRDPRMGELYTGFLNWWRDSVGGAFVHFNSLGTYSMWGSWGELEYITQDPATSPKYTAIQNWIAANPDPCGFTALPAEISYFRGDKVGNHSLLEWRVETSFDLDYFEIQRSSGNTENFRAIGSRKSINQPNNYQFTDRSPSIGNNYYRLKMVDSNGAFQYSEIILIEHIGGSDLNIYPTMVESILNLELEEPINQPFSISIVNLNGQLIREESMQAKKKLSLNLSDLQPGIYFIKTNFGASLKFIKI